MKPGRGLQAKFLTMAAIAVLVIVTVLAGLLQRQRAMQREVIVLGQQSIQALVLERLRVQGEAVGLLAADELVNPLYYFDLESIGRIVRGVLNQPDVEYVTVYDPAGMVIHDGSPGIASYGKPMLDAIAGGVVNSRTLLLQTHADIFDVSAPISIGDQRLGGIRIGYSLESVRHYGEVANKELERRIDQIGQRYLIGIVLLLATLVVLGLAVSVVMQRTLIRPVRRLAEAAREIEEGNFAASLPSRHNSDEIGQLVHAFARMTRGISRHDRDMRHMANTDALTGLANRRAFRERLEEAVARGSGTHREFAVVFADIDDFKRVNDTFGHDVGDELLCRFADRISDTINADADIDALLARLGGDEFVLFVKCAEGAGCDLRRSAAALAETLVHDLSKPLAVAGHTFVLGTSFGIAMFPQDAQSASLLMKNGDIAMYHSKHAGKNRFSFYMREMEIPVERRLRVEQDLHGAWERGELTMAYQPIFRLSDARLVGAEALLRWDHPLHGSVDPSMFIDVAERSSLIQSMGARVLHAACAQLIEWRSRGPAGAELFVAVNVSPVQLRDGDLAAQVESALADTGLNASSLHLEITETTMIGDGEAAGLAFARLRDVGVRIWLDDFGTGFSGLSHLRRIPVDGVKIDRSYVADLLDDADDLALVTAIITMAHALGMSAIAEGVEQRAQMEILRGLDCDFAQGFHLGSPVDGEAFARLLDARGS